LGAWAILLALIALVFASNQASTVHADDPGNRLLAVNGGPVFDARAYRLDAGDTATPTDTPTDTPVPPTTTPTDTATNTPVVPTNTATDTPTDTPIVPTNTPTDTPTNTPVAPTNTPTKTPTNTPVPPTSTPTNTPTPTPIKVNAQLRQIASFVVSSSRYPDPTYPAQSPKGVVVGRIVVRNLGVALRNVSFRVVSLSNNNYLLNADGGPGRVGSKLSVPNRNLPGGNQLWDRNENLSQDFRVGLLSRASFRLVLDVYANRVTALAAANGSNSSAGVEERIGSITIDLDPATPVYTLNLPVIIKLAISRHRAQRGVPQRTQSYLLCVLCGQDFLSLAC
jgi:hypothetical protein